jgi:hypothetical protein
MTVLFAGPSAPAGHGALGSRPSLVTPVASLPPLLSPGREGPMTVASLRKLLSPGREAP